MSKKVLYCPDCDVEFTVRFGMSDSHYTARHCVFCGEEINNDEDYIEKASYYASSISVLNTIRKDLFNRINQTPLFDTKQFTNDFCWSLDQMIKEINKNYK